MQQQIALKLLPSEAADNDIVKSYIAATAGKEANEITGFQLLRKSIDARAKQVYINLTVNAFINEPYFTTEVQRVSFANVRNSSARVIIVGAGPTGLFAALKLLEQ